MVELFHKRFGGQESIEQELQDLTGHLPLWLRPFYKAVLPWLLRQLRRAKIRRTMASVDQQAKEIADIWQKTDRAKIVNEAVDNARMQHPEARVEVIAMPDQPLDAVLIEHPPDPRDKAQVALGFGSIEIRAPFYGRS